MCFSIISSDYEGRTARTGEILGWWMSSSEEKVVFQQFRELAASIFDAHVYLDSGRNLSGVTHGGGA